MMPSHVVETMETLKVERSQAAGRLDAIDLALENIGRLFPITAARRVKRARPKRKKVRKVARKHVSSSTVDPEASTQAGERRNLILALIGKSEVGLTAADLRKLAPKISDSERQNALTVLKAQGNIKRAGNTWVKV